VFALAKAFYADFGRSHGESVNDPAKESANLCLADKKVKD
jgi:hypothetical protein